MNGKYLAGAIAGSLVAGAGITAMMMAGERKSGKPSELIDLERASARKFDVPTPEATELPTPAEQTFAQGGHMLLSGLAGLAYAATTNEDTDPLVGGVLFGLSFYALAHWLAGPLLGVKAPEWTQGGKTIGMHTVNHVAFGLVTALAARAATRSGRSG
ncbi:hypothetical protein [Sphingomonas profundi]|uniref:hypothetical protein n=1 Tax=Alterirhizorhabdus profundi TaxID=2681549 RepID=UPI0012E98D16|nr:hypothetical protein [Sphingomonas profundi]